MCLVDVCVHVYVCVCLCKSALGIVMIVMGYYQTV
jgi:hypothetical protein